MQRFTAQCAYTEYRYAIAALSLGIGQGEAGLPLKLAKAGGALPSLGAVGLSGNPDAGGDEQGLPPDRRHEHLDRMAQSFGQCHSTSQMGFGQEDRKLLTTDAADDVTLADAGFDTGCDCLQDVIACLVAPGLVHCPETVEVNG